MHAVLRWVVASRPHRCCKMTLMCGAMVMQALLEAERKGMVPLLEAPKHFHDKAIGSALRTVMSLSLSLMLPKIILKKYA